ncbi:hypothetical protein DFP94_101507 [Fontibacillus phaseoli]|uniref:Uncharacterized protein n=1 Tax=Fontibacillus phaseoli TaxID=1416533 RepID=A0A369BQI4_9BACL|nr:hypothetical protein [Fontibacillus phaseoli]RCX22918.1 hypothetical protein DFP94_101507 [Fontibacillus phaseoli]
MKIADLFVLACVDADGNITGYPKGGGSSTAPSIRTYERLESARRGQRFIGGKIVRITGVEVVK